MSIGRLQELFQSKGCQVLLGVVAIIILIVMVLPSAFPGMNGLLGGGRPAPGSEFVVKVGSATVTGADLDDSIRQLSQQSEPDPSVQGQIQRTAGALYQVVQKNAMLVIANDRKVEVTPDTVRQYFKKAIAEEIETQRKTYITEGKLKADATDAQFNELFKKDRGSDPAAYLADNEKQLDEALKNPDQEKMVLENLMPNLVFENYKSTMEVSDEDLKATYDTFMLKQITFGDFDKPLEDRQKEAEAALAEIKAGAKFDDVMKKHNPEASAEPIEFGRNRLETTPGMEPIANLKKGEVSDVSAQFGMPTIFFVSDITQKIPEDFEKKKEDYRKEVIAQRAALKLQEDIKAYINGDRTQWGSDIYKGFYQYAELRSDPALMFNMGEMRTKMEEIEDLALTRTSIENPNDLKPGDHLAPLLRFAAQDAYYAMLSEQEKSAMRPERIETIQAVLETTDDAGMRIELYSLLLADGDKEMAVDQLVQAVDVSRNFDLVADQNISRIRETIAKAEADKTVDAETLKPVKDALTNWTKEKAEFLAEEAKLKEEQQKADAELEAERKALEEEMRQQESAQSNSPATNAPAPNSGP
ncbi:MAG: SurA N-terminal domain-containing protein [Fimbriimonadaceae bacterium]|nr:SurA N-terminal domain-containing protein [Fimbriimonadaceae bacterium]